MEALEQRIFRLYQYIGDPQGELFASAKQVQRLETIIQTQQQIIDRLQSQQTFFQKDAAAYFEDQLEQIVKQRGIRNTDFISLTKFFTQNLTHAVTTLQSEFSAALKTSLQTEKLQDLEIQIKQLKNSSSPGITESENSGTTGKIQELETRLSILEIQSPQMSAVNTAPEKQSVKHLDSINDEIINLKEHVKHLETNLITEVQKHYKMSTKQGELAAPLTRIQNTVQMLDKEFQSFRGVDVRKIAEAMIHSATENLRTEFQTVLATRASMEQLNKFDADVRRIEAYSTDVQTGFYRMKTHLEDVSAKMTDSFSETRWNRLENSLKNSLEIKQKEQHADWKMLLETQDTEIQKTVNSVKRSAEKVFEDIKANTSPEAFEVQLQRLKTDIIQSQDGWLEKIAEPLQSRMTTVEQQSQQTRTGFLELASEMKTELAATNLKTRYAEFEEKLAGFNKVAEDWNKRLQKSEESHKQILAFSEARVEQTSESIRTLETEYSRIRNTVAELQQQTKATLDTWLRDRNGDIQKRFTDAAQEIQQIQRSTVTLESELYKQLEIYRNQERVWAEKYREFQAASETTVVAWREEQSAYIISRLAELSSEVRVQLTGNKERLAEIEEIVKTSDISELHKLRDRLVDMSDRIQQLQQTYNTTAMRKMQTEIESGLRLANDEWLNKRADDIMKNQIDTFQHQINRMNQKLLEDRAQFMKRYDIITQDEKAAIKTLNEKYYTENASRLREFITNETGTIRNEIVRTVEADIVKQFTEYKTQIDKIYVTSERLSVVWRDEQLKVIQSRMTELSSEVRTQLTRAEGRVTEMEKLLPSSDSTDPYEYSKIRDRLVEMADRIQELNKTYNTTAMRKMKTELETSLHTSNAEWLNNRADDIMKTRLGVLQDQINTMARSLAEERAQFIKRYELITDAEKIQIRRLNDTYYTENANRMKEYIINETDTIRIGLLKQIETEIVRQFTAYKSSISTGKHTPINTRMLEYQSQSKCFYTALFGTDEESSDRLSKVQPINGWDYICFTNLDIQEPNGWTIVKVTPTSKLMALEAKRYKWQSHKYLEDYDIVVWVDAYISPASFAGDKLYQWITLMNERGLSVLHRKHDTRDCIWDECEAVVAAKRDTPENVKKITTILTAGKMPRHIGLYDTNIIVKFHKRPALQKVANEITQYLEEYTIRDQLVVTYVYYKNNFNQFSTTDLMRAFEKTGHHMRKTVPPYT